MTIAAMTTFSNGHIGLTAAITGLIRAPGLLAAAAPVVARSHDGRPGGRRLGLPMAQVRQHGPAQRRRAVTVQRQRLAGPGAHLRLPGHLRRPAAAGGPNPFGRLRALLTAVSLVVNVVTI